MKKFIILFCFIAVFALFMTAAVGTSNAVTDSVGDAVSVAKMEAGSGMGCSATLATRSAPLTPVFVTIIDEDISAATMFAVATTNSVLSAFPPAVDRIIYGVGGATVPGERVFTAMKSKSAQAAMDHVDTYLPQKIL